MEEFLTSLLAIVMGVVVNIVVVPRILWLTTGIGNSVRHGFDNDGDSSNVAAPFVAMLIVLVGWAYACFSVAEYLAGEDFGNRWVLLFIAAALAGSPYQMFQLRARRGIAYQLLPPLQTAIEFAGGLQSLIVIGGMLSGIHYDWWYYLPG